MKSDQKLRIALLAPLWTSIPPASYGGIELLMHLLVEDLVARGHEVTLFATAKSRTSARLHTVCEENLIDAMTEGRAYSYEYYTTASLVEAIRNHASFDLIHSHLGVFAAPMSKICEVPMVHTIHTAITPDDHWVFQQYPETPYIAVSASQISVVPPSSRERITVIHNACDIDAYDLSDGSGDYLVFLGRMGAHKNPVDAIRIAQMAGMPIVLAGQPQSEMERQYFEEQVRPLINGKTVKWVGSVNHEQKRELFRHAAAFLFPTCWAEPCAVAPLEALASGLPVLAYPNGSVPELIEPGITGFYADNAESLATLVQPALELDRRAIRERARQRFSHQRYVDEHLAVYRSLL